MEAWRWSRSRSGTSELTRPESSIRKNFKRLKRYFQLATTTFWRVPHAVSSQHWQLWDPRTTSNIYSLYAYMPIYSFLDLRSMDDHVCQPHHHISFLALDSFDLPLLRYCYSASSSMAFQLTLVYLTIWPTAVFNCLPSIGFVRRWRRVEIIRVRWPLLT